MGMYTALHYATELKKDTPEQVISVLKYMSGLEGREPESLPEHPFFKSERWRFLFRTDSYYFPADTHTIFRLDEITGTWFLTVTSNIKNYDSEIEKFLNWITPYSDAYEGDFQGYTRYEETENPTLIHYSKPNVKPPLHKPDYDSSSTEK